MVCLRSTRNNNQGRERNGKCLGEEGVEILTHMSRDSLSTERVTFVANKRPRKGTLYNFL